MEQKKTSEKGKSSFLKSRTLWINVLLMFVVTILLVVFTKWFLDFYTSSGRTIVVPHLVGQTPEEVRDALKNGDLDLVIVDSVYNSRRGGEIVDQNPCSGKKVKKGRTIYVVVNAHGVEMALVPNLVDQSLRAAEVVLENAGFKLGQVVRKPGYKDLVLGQEINGNPCKPNQKAPRGSAVDVVVGSGADDGYTLVPDVVGLSLREASVAVGNANLVVGSLIYDDTVLSSLDSATAVVWKQVPAFTGESQPSQTTVNLWLTTDVNKVVP